MQSNLFEMYAQLFETFGVECPNCHGSQLLRPKQPDANGNKMAGTCPKCGYSQKNGTAKRRKLTKEQEWTRVALKRQAYAFLKAYSIYTDSETLKASFDSFNTKSDSPEAQTEMEQAYATASQSSKQIANSINGAFREQDSLPTVNTTRMKPRKESDPVHCMLFGTAGRGKTHLAVAMINDILKRTGYRAKAMFIDIELFTEFRKMAISDPQKTAKINEINSRIQNADVVVIDDLGTESNTEWGKNFIDVVFRYREKRSTIVTTNLDPANMKDNYDSRTVSRMRRNSRGHAIIFDEEVPDHRSI
jgi:DNA replication protein DnaC